MKAKQEKQSFVGVWMLRELEEKMEYYIKINKNHKVFGCEIKRGRYEDDYEGKVEGKQLTWDLDEDDDEDDLETYSLRIIKKALVLVGEETDSYERIYKFHPKCKD